MKAVGILGGTFDPIHVGHLITAQSVLEKRNLEKIIFIPCNISPHKQGIYTAPAKHRYEMARLAIKDSPQFEISNYEIEKGDISYTHDTLIELSKTYERLELIIGIDNLVFFHEWQNPDGILELANLIVLKRIIDMNVKSPNEYYSKAIFVDTPTIQVSSTDIREKIRNNISINNLVPAKVQEYISTHKLYR